jgi:hypothetical protein
MTYRPGDKLIVDHHGRADEAYHGPATFVRLLTGEEADHYGFDVAAAVTFPFEGGTGSGVFPMYAIRRAGE